MNGAFEFEIDRAQNRAYLEPRDALLALCPFNPARPTSTSAFPTTCVIRRDIRRQAYPFRNGGYSTAVELPGEPNGDYSAPSANREQCALFMQTIMGESDYAHDLGLNFSLVVAKSYALNDRYMRAWWINPGYEWTPTQVCPACVFFASSVLQAARERWLTAFACVFQTDGQSIFTISQKIILFALINLGISSPCVRACCVLHGADMRRGVQTKVSTSQRLTTRGRAMPASTASSTTPPTRSARDATRAGRVSGAACC